jgi:hypothetical protein
MSDPLEQIKELYYRTSKSTISHDFDAAVDLLKSMATENERERATVYMQGLAEMKAEWVTPPRATFERRHPRSAAAPRSAAVPEHSDRSTRGGRRPRHR